MVRATVDALKNQASPRQIASKRNLKVQDVIARRTDGSGNAETAA
jgi:small subunit ribosomal protein S5